MPDSKREDVSLPVRHVPVRHEPVRHEPVRHDEFGTPGRPERQDLETTPEPLASRFRQTLRNLYRTQFLPVSVRVAPWRSSNAQRSTSPEPKARRLSGGFDPQKAPTTPDSPRARLASKIARDSGASGFFVVARRDSEPSRANSGRFWVLIGVATLAGVISTVLGAAFLASKQRAASVVTSSSAASEQGLQEHTAGARPFETKREKPAQQQPSFTQPAPAEPVPGKASADAKTTPDSPAVPASARDALSRQSSDATSEDRKWKERLEEFPVLE